MSEHSETEALRTEVAELRAEVERLRSWQNSHVCAPAPVYSQYYQTAAAAGCAGGAPILTFPNVAGANPIPVETWHYDTTACAAPAPTQTFFFNVPG